MTMLSDDGKTLDNPPFPCRALDFAHAANADFVAAAADFDAADFAAAAEVLLCPSYLPSHPLSPSPSELGPHSVFCISCSSSAVVACFEVFLL